jgi:dipeptidyl aminopeptidase/acylaminoacyl peptidase
LPISLLAVFFSQSLFYSSPVSDYTPAWSPTGSHIAFLRYESGPFETYSEFGTLSVIDPDGSNRIELERVGVLQAEWAPDGHHVLYRRGSDTPEPFSLVDIVVVRLRKGS